MVFTWSFSRVKRHVWVHLETRFQIRLHTQWHLSVVHGNPFPEIAFQASKQIKWKESALLENHREKRVNKTTLTNMGWGDNTNGGLIVNKFKIKNERKSNSARKMGFSSDLK